MVIAIVITVVLLIHDWSVTGVGWTVLIAGALLGSLAGLDAWTTRTAGSPAPVPRKRHHPPIEKDQENDRRQ